MVGNISSTSPASHFPEPPEKGADRKVQEELLKLEKELRADMGPPVNEAGLEKLLPKMLHFLEHNKEALFKMMEKQGYPLSGPFSITAEFNSAIGAIHNYMEHPNLGSLDFLNESVTQINYYVNTPNHG
ncbi:MAG: hypothetical protein JJU12_02050 [Chlamydiales bacterium]|nr:hypothetical protein [Chlamydiales bacterium]